jgi:homocysteine S-methyltransferase
LATHLEALGADISGPLWSARVLADHPEVLVDAHADFIDAGARVVISASYQVSRGGFVAQGRSAAQADVALRRSVEVAREAVHRRGADASGVLVAASVGPYGAITHDGGEYRGRYGLTHEELVDFHGERIEILAEADPDLLAVETIPDADEAAAIAEVLVDYPDLPAWMTFSCGDERTTWAGQPISEAVRAAVCAPSVTAIGVNCVAPHLVTGLLGRIAGATDLPTGMPLVAYPNAGRVWLPDTETWSDSAAGGGRVESASGTQGWPVTDWVFAGARLIGGCCCVEPEAVSALAEHLA